MVIHPNSELVTQRTQLDLTRQNDNGSRASAAKSLSRNTSYTVTISVTSFTASLPPLVKSREDFVIPPSLPSRAACKPRCSAAKP